MIDWYQRLGLRFPRALGSSYFSTLTSSSKTYFVIDKARATSYRYEYRIQPGLLARELILLRHFKPLLFVVSMLAAEKSTPIVVKGL